MTSAHLVMIREKRMGRLGERKLPAMITFVQQNVDRNKTWLQTLLALARDRRTDVVMVQEPLSGQARFPNAIGYKKFIPFSTWNGQNEAPRVCTYVRSGGKECFPVTAMPSPVNGSRDLLLLRVGGMYFLNIYRSVLEKDTWVELIQSGWVPPLHVTIGGDFNAYHTSWFPNAQYSNWRGGADIANWMDSHDLTLVSQLGQVTHHRAGGGGTVIDLVFSSASEAEAHVDPSAGPPSNHKPIVGFIPCDGIISPNQSSALRRYKLRENDEDKARLVTFVKEGMTLLPGIANNPASLDEFAFQLTALLSEALEVEGRLCTGMGPQRKPWWNEACQVAHRAILSRRHQDLPNRVEVEEFQATVRQAIRQYWRNIIDGIQSGRDMHKVVGWHKRGSGFAAPPISHGGRAWYEDSDKSRVLREAKLAREPIIRDEGDPWSVPVPRHPTINKERPVLRDETRRATIGATTTAPGGDGIDIALLKLLWPMLEEPVTQLFDACVKVGYHPKAFRRADVIMIEKAGRPLDSPGGWRPISLLNVLGKGLERLMSWRLSRDALLAGLLNDQQFGALPGRSATDLVSCLVHDIELAFARGEVAVLVTNDVKGAFDGVLHGRMILRMRE